MRRTLLNSCLQIVQKGAGQECLLCGATAGREGLCAACTGELPLLPPQACPRCALPTPDGAVCGPCLARPRPVAATVAVLAYRFPVDALIHALKYGGRLSIAPVLGELLLRRVQAVPAPDLLVPMPLHPARLRERGFNQALEIARRVAKARRIPLAAGACVRLRNTAPQVSLPWKERSGNVRGAFACSRPLDGLRVALVDDVMTTGATLNELAETLRKGGAAEVHAWVLARTLPPG